MNQINPELAVIFDMDGIMIESEHNQSRSFEAVMKENNVKPEYNENGVIQTPGITAKDNLIVMKNKYNLEPSVNELLLRKNILYSEILDEGVEVLPGLYDLLAELKGAQVKTAVASSSIKDDILKVLKHLKLEGGFDTTVSGEEVENSKPAPDIFIKAAQLIDANVENCVVLEDSESGVAAAKAANMSVIAIPSQYTARFDFTKADLVVRSLEELKIELLKKLVFAS